MGLINSMTIAQETHSQLNPMRGPRLTRKRQREIRFNGVRRLIESKESGHLFTTRELIEAAGYHVVKSNDSAYNSGWSFLQTLLKNENIVRIDDGPNRGKYAYCVTNKSLHGRPTRNVVLKTAKELLTQRQEEDRIARQEAAKDVGQAVEEKALPTENQQNLMQLIAPDVKYSFKFTLQKRQVNEHGKVLVSEVEVNDVSLDQIKKTVEHIVGNFESLA